MSKELDPSLFGEGSLSSPRTAIRPNDRSAVSVEILENKYVDLRVQIRELKEELNRNFSQMEHAQSTLTQAIDEVRQRLNHLEQVQGRVSDEVVLKVSQLHHRFGERQSYDRKVQDLIDRHQAILRASELRLSQLQKILQEKEAQTLSAQATLGEARNEILRLKRL